jgi:predicted RNA-binding protein with PUA-like domain
MIGDNSGKTCQTGFCKGCNLYKKSNTVQQVSTGDEAVKYYSFQNFQNINYITSIFILSHFMSQFDIVEYVHSPHRVGIEFNSNIHN